MYTRDKQIYVVFSLLLLALVLTSCGIPTESNQSGGNRVTESEEHIDYPAGVKENPIVTITMDNQERIIIELEPATAPNTVANFISLAEEGYYDGLIFHRVIPGFMIQGGDPSGNGTGGPGYTIAGEFTVNGYENNLNHERGVISMARSKHPDSAGSQFFIMVAAAPHLDGEYAAFGKVIEGMDTVDSIVAAARDRNNKPLEDQRMLKVEVDTKGFEYPAPKVLE